MGRRAARFKALMSAFWLCGDLIVGLREVVFSFFVVFHLYSGGRGGNANTGEGRELFSIKIPANHVTALPTHTPRPPPRPRPLTAFPSLTYGRNSSKGTVSCFCLTRRYNFQEYSREMMRNRLRQPYTCQDMQEFREFCPFASTQAEKSGVICSGT